MKIKVNDKDKHIDVTGCKTLKDVLDAITRDDSTSGSIVNQVFLNGMELTGEQDSEPGSIFAEEIRDLEVYTATPREISAESIQLASGQLFAVVEETRKTAELFRYNDESEANQRLLILIEIFQKFVHLLELLKHALRLDFSSITTESKSLEELQHEMIGTLSQILVTQQNKDWVSLADLLEFELVPLLHTWSRVIPTLACSTDNPN